MSWGSIQTEVSCRRKTSLPRRDQSTFYFPGLTICGRNHFYRQASFENDLDQRPGINVTGDIRYRIKGDMRRIHPQVKKPFIMAHTRLVWFNSYRHNQMRWLTFFFFPQMDKEPLDTLSRIQLDMKSWNFRQILLFSKIILGGSGES